MINFRQMINYINNWYGLIRNNLAADVRAPNSPIIYGIKFSEIVGNI